jgi:hypothetical protein
MASALVSRSLVASSLSLVEFGKQKTSRPEGTGGRGERWALAVT